MRGTFVNKERYFYNTGVALTGAGPFNQGDWFLKRALQHFPGDRRVLYSLMENRILAGDAGSAKKYTLQLLEGQSITTVKQDLERLQHDYFAVPVNTGLITPQIFVAVREIVINLEHPLPANDHDTNR